MYLFCNRRILFFFSPLIFIGLCFSTLPHNLYAGEGNKPRCALIDMEKTPLGGLLEAQLLVRDDTDWLERSEIEKILSEKKIQNLYAANNTGARKSLGQILKADILIILQSSQKDNQPFSQIVVTESNQGLCPSPRVADGGRCQIGHNDSLSADATRILILPQGYEKQLLLNGDYGLQHSDFSIDIYSLSYDEMKNISTEVHDSLHSFAGDINLEDGV